MDREEMRFHLLRDELKVPGQGLISTIQKVAEIMDAYDRTRPDYQDPAKLEETIQARVDEAVEKERAWIIERLSGGRGILLHEPYDVIRRDHGHCGFRLRMSKASAAGLLVRDRDGR